MTTATTNNSEYILYRQTSGRDAVYKCAIQMTGGRRSRTFQENLATRYDAQGAFDEAVLNGWMIKRAA